MTFISHLGISQHFVHKRITDALLHELCDMIRHTSAVATSTSTNSTQEYYQNRLNKSSNCERIRASATNSALYDLLKSCWVYTTTISELRPILWTILKQLGHQTPIPVLLALTERADTYHHHHHYDDNCKTDPLRLRLQLRVTMMTSTSLKVTNTTHAKSDQIKACGNIQAVVIIVKAIMLGSGLGTLHTI